MIKSYQFIKKIMTILKENNFSLESDNAKKFLTNLPIYLQSIQTDSEYLQTFNKINQEKENDINQLLQTRLLEILESQFFYYYIFHKEVWDSRQHDYIYNSSELLKERMEYLSKITNINSVSMSFLKKTSANKEDTLHRVNITGDMIFDTVDFMGVQLNVHFESDYMGKVEGKSYFKEGKIVKSKKNYFKNISLLSLAAAHGCDYLIEQLIIKGCNVYYKDGKGKMALDYYNPILPLTHERTIYTQSLLDGSYKNGYYQSLYEKAKLSDSNVLPEEKKEKITNKL